MLCFFNAPFFSCITIDNEVNVVKDCLHNYSAQMWPKAQQSRTPASQCGRLVWLNK